MFTNDVKRKSYFHSNLEEVTRGFGWSSELLCTSEIAAFGKVEYETNFVLKIEI